MTMSACILMVKTKNAIALKSSREDIPIAIFKLHIRLNECS